MIWSQPDALSPIFKSFLLITNGAEMVRQSFEIVRQSFEIVRQSFEIDRQIVGTN